MNNAEKPTFMERVAAQIVDRRNLIFLLFIALGVFSIFSRTWVKVNDDLTVYLDKDTETRQGLTLMDEQFSTYATAKVMVANVTLPTAQALCEEIEQVAGVHDVAFDGTEDHYRNASALFSVTFDGAVEDEASVRAMEEIRTLLSPYDLYVVSDVGNPMEALIVSEMSVVLLIAVAIIVAVLLFTSHTYMEIPVLLLTFGAAALLNMGTNYWFGTISFVTNAIAVVLQLALAIDYAIILCHRYTEERQTKAAREAVVAALSKAIPEVSASSLTTVSGLCALMLMRFRLGFDMGMVLIKAIGFSLLSVFLLMPGLLMVFSSLIDRTHHRSFVPKINLWGKMTVKTRAVVPPIFLLAAVAAFVFSSRCPYVYSESGLDTPRQNEQKIAAKMVEGEFGQDNLMALVVPAGDYEKEAALLADLRAYPEVKSVLGLANVEVNDQYTLTSALTPRQFSELADLDIEVARLLYTAYAVGNEEYGQVIADVDAYDVPLVEMFLYLYEQKEEGYVKLDAETDDKLGDLYKQITFARSQLCGPDYARFVLLLNLPEESEETFAFLGTLHQAAGRYYDEAYLVGNSQNAYDLSKSFVEDNLLISVLSAVFVIIVLLFTFRSAGLPLLLILVIQSSIFLNFSVPYLTGSKLFFISYLIVSAIQMGANIDYAIVISNRYLELKKAMPYKEAMVQALNQSFPTIITSGSILVSAGLLIGQLTSENTIASIGTTLGRGTIVSILLVMGVLPQILMLGDAIIERTAFSLPRPKTVERAGGAMRLNGRVRGQVTGFLDAEVRGIFQGSISAQVDAGAVQEPEGESDQTAEEKEGPGCEA